MNYIESNPLFQLTTQDEGTVAMDKGIVTAQYNLSMDDGGGRDEVKLSHNEQPSETTLKEESPISGDSVSIGKLID